MAKKTFNNIDGKIASTASLSARRGKGAGAKWIIFRSASCKNAQGIGTALAPIFSYSSHEMIRENCNQRKETLHAYP